jgi:hypothetical protein
MNQQMINSLRQSLLEAKNHPNPLVTKSKHTKEVTIVVVL